MQSKRQSEIFGITRFVLTFHYSTMATAFAGSLNNPVHSQGVPLAQAVSVSDPEQPPPGLQVLAGFELWVPPKPNVYRDGLPVYEVSNNVKSFPYL